jgi:hydrogenase/urease accessory protein HupE
MPDHPRRRRPSGKVMTSLTLLGATIAAALATLGIVPPVGSAAAHGFSSVVYVDVTAAERGRVQAELDLEYDLLVVSVADTRQDPGLFSEGIELHDTDDQSDVLNAHARAVVDYVAERFTVTADGEACPASQAGDLTVHERDGVPYARLVLEHRCPVASDAVSDGAFELKSDLFPDDEQYVVGTETIVTYELDGRSGSGALDAASPTLSTEQSWTERFGEFFMLGAEHLLGGPDHILFLLALIVASRRLRDVVLAATTFTVAHSVTFVLAALGLVAVPIDIVEPMIALSIAVVGAWYLWDLRRRRVAPGAEPLSTPAGRLSRSDGARLAVVFCFGLFHGLGFAGALGIQEAWSWTLLWSLLVFNVGIELAQLTIIAITFPLLLLVRRSPRVGLWTSVVIAGGVTAMGLVWFAERVIGRG